MTSRDYFKSKRIAVIGLGHHGEMVEDVKFLIKAGALVSVYDLKSEARLKNHLVFLRTIGLANYVCGGVPADDLLDMDMIVLSHEYPRNATFLSGVHNLNGKKEKTIPIEYPETLFVRQAPPVTIVGVIGACGKSTLVSMLDPLLRAACSTVEEQGFFVIDPESNDGILSHLKKVKTGDIVLFRMVSLIMKELYEMRISPQVAVFASAPSPESYFQNPFEILSYQTYNNYIIASDDIIDMTHPLKIQPKAKMLRTKASIIPVDWSLEGCSLLHNRDNAALALQTASLFKIENDAARIILTKWRSLKGRLEFIKKIKNTEFYNDTASVRPASTLMAIKSLAKDRNIVLILGGAKGNGDYKPLYEAIPLFVHTVVLLPGSGTLRERAAIQRIQESEIKSAPSIEEAVRIAVESAKKGDIILFSPGFDAAGPDGSSRKERGERFVRAVRGV